MIKSIWEIFYTIPFESENDLWCQIIENLSPLFRKNTLHNLISSKKYYPQIKSDCRFYVKPNNGSCGKGIKILNHDSQILKSYLDDEDYTICPEIISKLINKNGKNYKSDYRVWIAIKQNLDYHIFPTFIQRISNIPFDINSEYGSITNTALYSDQFDYYNKKMFNQINIIVSDVLKHCDKLNSDKFMLTGWDFIEDDSGKIYLLEVNCNPSLCVLHYQVMTEFLTWINTFSKIY